MIEAVLFDKDGVLFDFQKTWGAWAHDLLSGLSEGDVGLYRALSARIGFDPEGMCFDPTSALIAGTPEDGVALILPLLPDWSFEGLVAHANAKAAQAPIVETTPLAPLMNGLRDRGLKLGVSTNDAEGSARAHLAAVGAETYFDMIMGSDSGYGAKPAPGMQNAFAARMEIGPARIVMVGDSTHDIEAGRAAGMHCVGVLTGPATRADLAPHADQVLESIAALPEWLDDF